MRYHARMSLGVIGAVFVLAVAISTASATRLAFSSETFRVTWARLVFSGTFGVTISCPVTLEGTMHSRTIVKTAGNLVGYVTRAIVGEAQCTGGRARMLTETLPWHTQYVSFEGGLPNITAINVRIIRFSTQLCATVLGSTVCCLYQSSASEPVNFRLNREAAGVLTSVTAGGRIVKFPGSNPICEDINLSGTSAPPTVLGNTTRITVTLVT